MKELKLKRGVAEVTQNKSFKLNGFHCKLQLHHDKPFKLRINYF